MSMSRVPFSSSLLGGPDDEATRAPLRAAARTRVEVLHISCRYSTYRGARCARGRVCGDGGGSARRLPAIEPAVRIAVLVALGIRREAVLVAVLVRLIVLDSIFGEPVLSRRELAIELSGVNVSDLGVGDFARAGSAPSIRFGVLPQLLHYGGLGLGAVERGWCRR